MSGVDVKSTLQMAPWDVAFGVPAVVPRSPKQRFVAPVVWWRVRTSAGLGVSAPVGARAATQWQAQ